MTENACLKYLQDSSTTIRERLEDVVYSALNATELVNLKIAPWMKFHSFPGVI